jgi:O-acetylserine/cysteine efflux transporter
VATLDPMMNASRTRALPVVVVLALVAVLGWGLTWAPSAWLLEDWPPIMAAGIRVSIAGVLFLLVLVAMRKPIAPGCSWPVILTLGVLQVAAAYTCAYVGIKYGGAGLTSVLANTDPLFIALLAVWVLNERMARKQWIGLLAGFIGVVMISWSGPLWPPSLSLVSLLVVASTFSWAVATVATARRIGSGASPLAIAAWSLLVGGVVMVLLSLVIEHQTVPVHGRDIAALAWLVVVGTIIPFAAYYSALTRGAATSVSSWILLVPVIGVLTSWPLLGEEPTPALWGGLVLVCAGLYLVFRYAPADSAVNKCIVPTTVSASPDVAGVSALDGADTISDADREWLAALERALEDRHLTPDKVMHLDVTAAQLGLSDSRVARLAGFYLADQVAHACADGMVSDAERDDIMELGALLGLDEDGVRPFLEMASPLMGDHTHGMVDAGSRVCFVGPMTARHAGGCITHDMARMLAESKGMVVVGSTVRKTDVIVAGSVDVLGPVARWRRRRGARVLVERAFWQSIGVDTD